MTRLTTFLDWLDEAAGGFIRLAYLLAGITAVAVYFGAGHLPPAIETALNAALPWSLAFAVETHTYITARRVRAAWQEKQRDALRVNLAVLAGLLAFSSWNQLNYLSETWTPPHTALALPGWLAYFVRALVVPAAFMAAAFLAPLAQPVAAQIEAEARSVLADVFRIARQQRKEMLKTAQRDGRDMTGALVELVTDDELRRVISHAYSAIAPAALPALPALTSPVRTSHAEAAPGESGAPPRPPTGPGSPIARPHSADAASATTARSTQALRLVPDTAPQRRRAAAQGRYNGKSVRTASAEAKARRAWASGARTVGEIVIASASDPRGRIGRSAASKYRRQFLAEESVAGEVAQ